jgi:hypothetical protein
VKIYVAAMEALRKKVRGGGQNRMKLSLPQKMVLEFHPPGMLMYFFAGFGPSGASITTMPMFSFASRDPYFCLLGH